MEQGKIDLSEKQGKELDFYPPSTMPVAVYTILLVLMVGLLGGGLYYFNFDQDKKISDLKSKIEILENQMSKEDLDGNLVDQSERLAKAVKSYNAYKEKDLNWQLFLSRVKDQTINDITYTSFAVDRIKSDFRVDGVAPSYRVIAEQMNIFSNDPNYSSVQLKTAVLRPESDSRSRVAFNLELTPKPEAFKKPEVKKDVFELIGGEGDQTVAPVEESDLTK